MHWKGGSTSARTFHVHVYVHLYLCMYTYRLTKKLFVYIYAPEGQVDLVTNVPPTCIYVFVYMYVHI